MKHAVLQKARFLIVDEPGNSDVLGQLLSNSDATNIVSTSDPREALTLFDSFRPDVVLLNVMMAEVDGLRVVEQLRPRLSNEDFLSILVLTADASDQLRHDALVWGATDCLTRPFDAVELLSRLHSLLEMRLFHQRLQNQIHSMDLPKQECTQQLAQPESNALERWAIAAEYREDETGHHAQRVGLMAGRLARALGLKLQEITDISRAAFVHDVGKIGIPDDILLKPDKLTPAEFEVVKTHTAIGAKILERHQTSLLQLAPKVALTHHERWDGKGYPQGLSGKNIPLGGRIVAVADVFDALTQERTYKKAWSLDRTVDEIQQQSGSQFDPQVVAAFMEVMRESY